MAFKVKKIKNVEKSIDIKSKCDIIYIVDR